MCGEKVVIRDDRRLQAGSPPRVRGKGALYKLKPFRTGITPACAGKSVPFGGGWFIMGDHPRVCGEKSHFEPHYKISSGSPPRVRGKGACSGYCARWRWITPACAGKSRAAGTGSSSSRDHPRVCGEKDYELFCEHYDVGSPPRVRGKVIYRLVSYSTHGITPACAGKRLGRERCLCASWDHPRVCGEKCSCPEMISKYMGSPPRVRGKA